MGETRAGAAPQRPDDGPTAPMQMHPPGRTALGRAQVLSLVLSAVGLVGVLVFGSLVFDAWYARWIWAGSAEYARMERQFEDALPRSAEPQSDGARSVRPDREGLAPEPASRTTSSVVHGAPAHPPARPAPVSPNAVASRRGVPPLSVVSRQRVSAEPDAELVAATQAELRFLDPPEPGAHAVLAVTVRNRSEAQSPSIVLSVPADWFDRFDIIGAVPPVLDDRVQDDGRRLFDFPGASPGGDTTLELHVVASGEDIGAPEVRVALREGGSLGELRAELAGAPPRLGPVRALRVPRLGIRTSVVDAAWEPPPFVAGQISATAALGEGNSVLIGHRGGHAGDVFARLLSARLGDEVVAASRGVDRRYIVSAILVLRGDDITPIRPTETPRLTLMTCTGGWNPVSGDYSHRLWVVAEPPDLARATLAATAAQASQAAVTSATPSEAARLRTDAALARAALKVMDVRRPSQP